MTPVYCPFASLMSNFLRGLFSGFQCGFRPSNAAAAFDQLIIVAGLPLPEGRLSTPTGSCRAVPYRQEIVQLLTCVMVGGSAKSARGSCDGGSVVAPSRSAAGPTGKSWTMSQDSGFDCVQARGTAGAYVLDQLASTLLEDQPAARS